MELFRQTVQLARWAGRGRLGLASIDGMKIRANASRLKAVSHGRLVAEEARLEAEIGEILARTDAVEAAEDRGWVPHPGPRRATPGSLP